MKKTGLQVHLYQRSVKIIDNELRTIPLCMQQVCVILTMRSILLKYCAVLCSNMMHREVTSPHMILSCSTVNPY